MKEIFSCLLASSIAFFTMSEDRVRFGDTVASLPKSLTEVLAGINLPDPTGAMGRNRKGYITVRFQMGLHHLANHAIATKNRETLEKFVQAVEYSFAHQTAQGDFDFIVSDRFGGQLKPSAADRASAVAFFLSSAASGLYAVHTSTWTQETAELRPLMERLKKIELQLPSALAYLSRQREVLEHADAKAPNRLLINALAFAALGKLTENTEAMEISRRFMESALKQVHPDGYFIEGGGYDSSYNGVGTATAFRLAAIISSEPLKKTAESALAWQRTRITAEGVILTEGNTRVHPGGESFFGKQKTVDAPHTVEALAWSSVLRGNKEDEAVGRRICLYYKQHSDKR